MEKMNCTFEQYLIDVGFRAALDYDYEREILINYVEYFRKTWADGIGAYTALCLLSDLD